MSYGIQDAYGHGLRAQRAARVEVTWANDRGVAAWNNDPFYCDEYRVRGMGRGCRNKPCRGRTRVLR